MSRPTAEERMRAFEWVCAQTDEVAPGCARAVFIRDAVRIAEEYAKAELAAALAELERECDEARQRCREAAQTLIAVIGAPSPEAVTTTAQRAVKHIEQAARERDEALRKLSDAYSSRSRLDCTYAGAYGEPDMGTKSHCPAESPCQRCTLERERDEAVALEEAAALHERERFAELLDIERQFLAQAEARAEKAEEVTANALRLLETRYCDDHRNEIGAMPLVDFAARQESEGCPWCREAKVERLREALREAEDALEFYAEARDYVKLTDPDDEMPPVLDDQGARARDALKLVAAAIDPALAAREGGSLSALEEGAIRLAADYGAAAVVSSLSRDGALARVAELYAEVQRLHEALTPSAATKAAYIGEVPDVSWSAIKAVLALVRKRADCAPKAKEGE